jgi:hypothetical protein
VVIAALLCRQTWSSYQMWCNLHIITSLQFWAVLDLCWQKSEKGNRCFVITYHFMTFCCMEVVKHIIAWLTICLWLRYCLYLCSWKSRIIIYEYPPPVELWMWLSVDSSNSSHPLHMGHGNTGFVRRIWAVYDMLKRDDWKRISFSQSTTQQTMWQSPNYWIDNRYSTTAGLKKYW